MLEQTKESCSYVDFRPKAPVCLVLGNEIEGVFQDISSYCDAAVEIEMAGIKNIVSKSLGSSNRINVARATIIALAGLKKMSSKDEENMEDNEAE